MVMCKNIEMRAVSTFCNDNSETIEYSVAYLSWVAKLWHQLPSVIRGKNITHKQLKMRIVIVKKYSSYGNLEKLIINSQPSQQSPALHKSTQVRQK